MLSAFYEGTEDDGPQDRGAYAPGKGATLQRPYRQHGEYRIHRCMAHLVVAAQDECPG